MISGHFSLLRNIFPLVLIPLLLGSCKKKSPEDSTGNDIPGTDRIKSMVIFSNSVQQSNEDYFYTGDHLDSVVYYDKQLGERFKWITSYDNGLLKKVTYYSKSYNTYPFFWSDEATAFTGNNPSEIIHTDFNPYGTITGLLKYAYTWSGNLLTEVSVYSNDGTGWLKKTGYTFQYSGTLRTEMLMHDWSGNGTDSKVTYTYNGTKLTEEVNYFMGNLSWKESQKSVYDYTGNQVSKIIVMSWNGNGWVAGDSSMFKYDSGGNVIEEITYLANGNSRKKAYSYISGSGIITELMMVSWPEWFTMSDAYPEPAK
jgi:hypothetical protein